MSDNDAEGVGILVRIWTNEEFPTEDLARAGACRAIQQVLVYRKGDFFIQNGTPEMVSLMKSAGINVEVVK